MSTATSVADNDIPAGFHPLEQGGPYFQALGPVYAKRQPDGTALMGLRIEAKHTNMLGVTHGGMLATLADSALGMNVSMLRQPRQHLVTVSLSVDYLSAAQPGDWLEAHVTVRRQGRQLAFAECLLRVGERVMLRASGVFSVTGRPRHIG
ncbi:PaaI family thioesterase [Aquincola sp. MAHUQ-54]|uniref:PaaI family thioesterase n=1 Tax=Aquincola agrisoli TaxID=3119538 RepID=A0AAW9Q0H9_9BURK